MKSCYCLFFCLLFCACGSGRLTPIEYKGFLEDPQNGFVQFSMIGTTHAAITHIDATYLAIQFFRTNDIAPARFQEAKDSYAGFEYFKIKLTDGEDRNLQSMNSFYDFQFQEHLRLISQDDTLPCPFYIAEPYNGIKREKNILIGFPNNSLGSNTVQMWIRPIVNQHIGSLLTFDLQRQKPQIEI